LNVLEQGDSGSPFNRKIMDYEKKYNEALGRAKKFEEKYGGGYAEYIFPELAESEDERIREWLVNYFKAVGKSWIHRDISPEQILAYLEKQKEQENTSASTMAPSCWAEEPSLQKVQKPDWSEEDEKMLDSIIKVVCGVGVQPNGLREKQVSFLKSLRPQYHGDVTMTEAYKMGLEAGKASSWEPSEEQMAALEAATVRYQSTGLESLFEDLKKL